MSIISVLSIGLSSLIDFGDTDEDSQKPLLNQIWNPLYNDLTTIYKTRKYHLPADLKCAWNLLAIFCEKNNSTVKAKKYLRDIMDVEYKNKGYSENHRILKVFEFVLELYDENIWIFDDNQKKSGTSVIFYFTVNCIITGCYKIDVRCVINSPGEDDIDVGALEAANELPSEKKKYDAAKLLIEAKDVLDLAINRTIHVEDIRSLSGTGFQVRGYHNDQKKSKVPEDDTPSTTSEATTVTTATSNTYSLNYDPDLVDEYG
ncbi:hypothetical protein HPULCUR_006088 [Helicostylum pulchrum]|uniref:Uncharacterized protein n=1 Tax=Helicostylum pulchrum TaxID=562976 RepID=A0ABP9Y0W8_9FUNG